MSEEPEDRINDLKNELSATEKDRAMWESESIEKDKTIGALRDAIDSIRDDCDRILKKY